MAYVTLNMYTDIFSDSDKLETQTELIIFLQIQVLKNLVFPSFTFSIHYRSLRCRILRYSGSEAFVRTPSTTPVLLLCGKNLKKKKNHDILGRLKLFIPSNTVSHDWRWKLIII